MPQHTSESARETRFRRGLSVFVLVFAGSFLLLGCEVEPEPDVTEAVFDADELAPFVEPDYPYITTSIDMRELGEGFPTDNIAVRCLALRLGNDAYACFDMDLLRMAAGWTGEFVTMTTMAQVSYRDFGNNRNQIPVVLGDPMVATGMYAGWMTGSPDFSDPRPPGPNPEEPGHGPISEEMGRWNGLHVLENRAVLDYTVAGSQVYEQFGSVEVEGEVGITRTFQMEATGEPLTLVLGEVLGGSGSEITDDMAMIRGGDNEDFLTAAGGVDAPEGAEFQVIEDRYITFHLPGGTPASRFTIVTWQGSQEGRPHFESMVETPVEMAEFGNGSEARWPDPVRTRGTVAPDTSAFVLDHLTLPVPNPWRRNVRVVDLDFFPDGRAAVVTFEGDIWIVDGITDDLRNMTWRRFASGLFEPKSIAVVDDTIYTFGREGIVRFHDLNGNGEADYHENFSNLMAQSIESREFPNHMVKKPGRGFYIAKMSALDMGPEFFEPVIPGIRAGSQHSGSVLEVSEDGRDIRRIASGFRGPYLGIHPETGMLTASDQEGHHVPSTPIYLVEEGGYYGVAASAHREEIPEEPERPITWIPHLVDQSGAGQVWATGGQMGPLDGELIHLSYGRPGAFRVFIDSTQNAIQGGVTMIPGEYPAPTMKGAIHPGDGQLYITGFLIWGTRADVPSAFLRMRYTGMESLLPSGLQAGEEGIILQFDVELDEASVGDVASYRVERWNYRRTEQYGSGHYRLDGSPGQEHLPVVEAQLSEDRTAILLAVPDMREVQQMEVAYNVRSAEGAAVRDEAYLTVYDVQPLDLEAHGFEPVEPELIAAAELAADEIEETISVVRGEELYQRLGCVACHSIDGSTEGRIGPTFYNLYMSERHLVDGRTVIADEDYLRTAILEPGETRAEGYDEGMPTFQGVLTEGGLASIIEFIKSLSEEGAEQAAIDE